MLRRHSRVLRMNEGRVVKRKYDRVNHWIIDRMEDGGVNG